MDGYDLVLLDCPPSVGTLTVNALVAADLALIVTEPARASIQGIVKTRETLNVVADEDLNPRLRLAGIVVTPSRTPRSTASARRRSPKRSAAWCGPPPSRNGR